MGRRREAPSLPGRLLLRAPTAVLLALLLSPACHAQTGPAATRATPAATTAAAAAAATATPAAAAATTTPASAATTTPAAATATTPAAATAVPAAAANAPAAPAVDLTGVPTPTTGAVKGNASWLLTTKTQANGPTIFVDGSGNEVIFKGIGWYGFNIGLTSLGNLTAGVDAISNDFKQIVYRQRMLGFNSIRVAFAFDDTWGINQPPLDWTTACKVPSAAAIMQTLVPGAAAATTIESNANTLPPLVPPAVPDNTCNADWPADSTYARFVWVIDYLISQGFYVMLDFHSNRYGDALAEGNESLYKQNSWIASWVALVQSVLNNTPAAAGRLLIDLINEPDGYSLTWDQQGRVPSLGSYYLNTIDALYKICPGCLYLIEGGGQATYCGVNWGNGFITDPSIIKELDISSPADFFTAALDRPWLDQVVLAPHIYCPEVSGATDCFSGTKMYDALDKSFGYLTVAPGFCAGGKCHVFPAILDEFGSTLSNVNETSCMASILQYSAGLVNPKTHAPLTSWFFWSWQPDSAGTGGIVADDWRTIVWEKIGLLTGGTKNWKTGMNLLPWYLTGFQDLTPVNTSLDTEAIALAPKAPTPVEAPVFGNIAAAPVTSIASDQSARATPSPTVPAQFVTSGNPIVSSPGTPTSITGLQTFGATSSIGGGGSGLSTGALAGIIAGGVVFVALVLGAGFLIVRLRNPRSAASYTPTSQASPLAPTMS